MYQSAMATLLSALALTSLVLITTAHAGRRNSQKNSGENFRLGVVSHATSTYTVKTNLTDVSGLANLCTQYPLLEEANGDPCFPPVWSWIECNSDPQPRVIALNLASRLLFVTLPDFSMMDALESIDLQQNSLYGTIPSFLGDFPNLQKLNLAYNLFTGQVPDSIACNKNLKLSLDGNYGLYASNSCPSGINRAVPTTTTTSQPNYSGDGYVYTPTTRKSKTPVIVGSVVSISGVIGIAVGIFAIFRHKAKVAAAVAAANAQGTNHEQSNPKLNIPMEEMPMNTRPTNLSP
ncbi:uncharacterized protein [Primulina huaijiensis]|uniref:uncharacterized protein n=1 Tax=Primulina huaijiensis TaxID=1492673 RepID=UPI003CC6FC20